MPRIDHRRHILPNYVAVLVVYLAFFIIAMALAPILPILAQMRSGPVNNQGGIAIEPRLPAWLFWFDTSTDNSLWGDAGWRTKHCPDHWNSYWGMVLWLWRNPACGYAWSVAAQDVSGQHYDLTSSGCGLTLDKSTGQQGWFLIRSNSVAFQYRCVTHWKGLQISFEAGWLLDVYLKNPEAVTNHPKAPFMFQPRIVKLK